MHPDRLERVIKTRQLTRLHLNEWGVTDAFLRTARSRGASREEAADLWRKFIHRYYGMHNSSGLVILDYPAKARYWGLQFLDDNGCKAERYVPLMVRYQPCLHDPDAKYGKDWQGLSLRMTLHHEPTPWIPSTYMPTLAGRLFYLKELAGPLVADCH